VNLHMNATCQSLRTSESDTLTLSGLLVCYEGHSETVKRAWDTKGSKTAAIRVNLVAARLNKAHRESSNLPNMDRFELSHDA